MNAKQQHEQGSLPEFAAFTVEWFYDSATIKDGDGKRIVLFKDSVRAKQFEQMLERANECNALRAENARLREALRPFAEKATGIDSHPLTQSKPWPDDRHMNGITLGDCRRAAEALKEPA